MKWGRLCDQIKSSKDCGGRIPKGRKREDCSPAGCRRISEKAFCRRNGGVEEGNLTVQTIVFERL
jgi:hypothetical protein